MPESLPWLAAPVIGVGVIYLSRSSDRALRAKFNSLKMLQGRSKEEIIEFVGPPSARSKAGENSEILYWNAAGYNISLIFEENVCRRVKREYWQGH